MPHPGSHDATVISRLLDHLAATTQSGRAVFLYGSPGSDLKAIPREFIETARTRSRRLAIATGDAGDPQTPAWRQIAIRLTRAQRAGTALRRSLSEWAGIIPVLGPLLGAAISTADELWSTTPKTGPSFGTGSAIDDVRWITAHGRNRHRLIVLENLHAADAAELSGAFALIQQLKSMATMLLVTATIDPAHPAPAVVDLLREAERLGVGYRIDASAMSHMSGLTPLQAELLSCADALGRKFGAHELAAVLGRDVAELESELERLARARRITLIETVERDGDLVDLYALTTAGPRS